MLQLKVLLIVVALATTIRCETKLTPAEDRWDSVGHQKNSPKTFSRAGKLYPLKLGTDTVVKNTSRSLELKKADGRLLPVRPQQRNFYGLLDLVPPPRHQQYSSRSYNPWNKRPSHRDGRNRFRYNGRQRSFRSRVPDHTGGSPSKPFPGGEASKKYSATPLRPPPQYESFPPYWTNNADSSKSNSYQNPKPRALAQQQSSSNVVKYVKKECNPCNSVPWTPVLKASTVLIPPATSYGVPVIEVHHDSKAYDSTQQAVKAPVVAPVANAAGTTIPESYGLPLGNIPTGHGLLPPINQLSSFSIIAPPPTILNPVPTDGLLQPIPFPELSPVPIVPIHDSNSFADTNVDTEDLVPPVPPENSASNVVFTISEQNHGEPVLDNHIGQPETVGVSGTDQHSESSSLNFLSNYNNFVPQPTNVNLDIVKSIPLAEYTSSIEYPLQIIQSSPIIDITTNATRLETIAYEKESATGNQKISDILLGLMQDSSSKNTLTPSVDNESSGTKLLQQPSVKYNGFLPTINPPDDSYQPSPPGVNLSPFAISNDNYQPTPPQANPSAFALPGQQHQPKFEPDILPDPTSSTWLVPAQSNIAPQWILPVSNPSVVPYPLLPEGEGIASIVNGEFSPSPSPQPMNEPKKKVQIIIPYTTGENKDLDQNVVETIQSKSTLIGNNTRSQNQPINQPQFLSQQTKAIEKGSQIAEFTIPENLTQNSKYLSDFHHVLALNIKELLKDEVEPAKPEQNIRLQKNIDNWTALEYSNHKTVAKKEPQDLISFATSVTSIPGTSISHLLLTSKKIPDGYLTTTPAPKFDEPKTVQYSTASVSVGSKPFTTKPYDTSSLYSTVTRNIPVTTTHRTIRKVTQVAENHRTGYTEIVKMKANQWAKLNENLVVPQNLTSRPATTIAIDKTTKDNVYIVTPVSIWETNSNSTSPIDSSRRTTRQVTATDAPIKTNFKLFANKTERAKISKFNKPKPIQKFFATTLKPPVRNITKIEIKTSYDFSESNIELQKSINDVFPFRNGGELPLELAKFNSTSNNSVENFQVRKDLVKQVKRREKVDSQTMRNEISSEEETETELPPGFTSLKPVVQPQEEQSKNKSRTTIDGIAPSPETVTLKMVNGSADSGTIQLQGEKSENSTALNFPPGIFGETKKVQVSSEEDFPYDLASLNKTIKLLKEYLKDATGELPDEKTETTTIVTDRT